jgi:LPXTG-site transpeptidase (sortase) family protein
MFKSSTPPPVSRQQLIELYRQAAQGGLPLEKVHHSLGKAIDRWQITETVEQAEVHDPAHNLSRRVPWYVKWGANLVPGTLLVVGLLLFGMAVAPVVAYFLFEMPQLQAKVLTAPIPRQAILDSTPVVITQSPLEAEPVFAQNKTGPVMLDTELDYTNLNNWFEGSSPLAASLNGTGLEGTTYVLDIPAVKITNAVVTIGGADLNKSLIQYSGTALPGEPGAPVIFGHSVLRQFYNPNEKNARRYNSIFSYIMTLKKGDKIFLTHNNVKYTYVVEDKTEVKPSDVHILTQNFDNRRLKLVTCTPEGTYLRRGVVTAVLVPTEPGT